MKNLNLDVIKKFYRKIYLTFLFSILFLIAAILLIYLGHNYSLKKITDVKSMNELIASDSETEGLHAYIDVNTVPYLFAAYETDGIEEDIKYYLVMDENKFLYVVYMDSKDFANLDSKDISKNPIRIVGTTKKMTEELKDFAISCYNEELGEEYLNDENFSKYVGKIYLDISFPIYNPILYYIGSFVCGILFLILIMNYIINMIALRKVNKKYRDEFNKIETEIYANKDKKYKNLKLYLTQNYIVDLSKSIIILKYEDIIWAYIHEYRYNGLIVNKCICLETVNKKRYEIAMSKCKKGNKDELLEKILNKISQKNKEILIGYTKENQMAIKEKFKKSKIAEKNN